MPAAVGHLGLDGELFLTLCGSVGFGVLLEEVEGRRFFGGELSGFRNFLDRSGNGHFRQQLNAAVVLKARTGGAKTSHDDAFLEAAPVGRVFAAARVGKTARGSLPAAGRSEPAGPKGAL